MELLQSYQLFIRVHKACDIQVGKLGSFHFPAGKYVYTGSARKNIEARVRRHLAREKKLRWHIDYLLTAPNVEVYDSKMFTGEECALNQAVSGSVLVKGFGASDCKNRCGSHLKYTGT
jgi:Uri superfamily endonuclease